MSLSLAETREKEFLQTQSSPEIPLQGFQSEVRTFEGELWTARQRQMHPIHYTVSYRASFKPELPEFFIKKYLLERGVTEGVVLDPFGGRGTTALQANLMGFRAIHNDLNPVSIFLSSSRQRIPAREQLLSRLEGLNLKRRKFKLTVSEKERLLPFFHPETLQEILNLRELLHSEEGREDPEIRYLGVTALSRLHGHSDGFFSVYTFPQISIMPESQKRNNLRRGQTPEYKSIKERIAKKIKKDLSVELPDHFHEVSARNRYILNDSTALREVKTGSVDLIVTSPPFLDKVDYISDNWMRSWFLNLEEEVGQIRLGLFSDVEEWSQFMKGVMEEMGRVLRPGGRAVIEVGEVSVGTRHTNLEELLIRSLPLKVKGGVLRGEELYINRQNFTKLANCWSVTNNQKGTNTNRCLVLVKE